jgi:N-acetyl-gamma-glutamyl-phosphate reductase
MDLVFLAVPEDAAAELAPPLVESGVRVIDLSGAFRIRDAAARSRWYPATKSLPPHAAYGLTEHYRNDVREAQLVANPGCYPTGALLAILPLAKAGLLDPSGGIVVDAKSGISGAGRAPSDRTHFSENYGSVAAYGVFGHRHVAEMEQEVGTTITFVPHLVPLDRGILETIYLHVVPGTTAKDIAGAFDTAYHDGRSSA